MKLFKKYNYYLGDIQQSPFKGLGKPEPLKGDYSGYWSRRITQKDRLIYRISNQDIEIVKCRDHY